MITGEDVHIEWYNFYEAHAKVVRHASLSERPVVVTTGTDISDLLLYALRKDAQGDRWYRKIDKEQYVDIYDVCRTYWKEVCNALSAFHSETGCNTTSYPYKVG